MDLSLVIPNSAHYCFVNSELVSHQPVGTTFSVLNGHKTKIKSQYTSLWFSHTF